MKKPNKTDKIVVVGVDPSSTCTGIAAIEYHTEKFIIWSKWVSTSPGHLPRMKSMIAHTEQFANEISVLCWNYHRIVFVLEEPSNSARHIEDRRGFGLTTMGIFVGVAACEIIHIARMDSLPKDKEIVIVNETEWTAGYMYGGKRLSKEARAYQSRAKFPELSKIHDPGYDVTDAAGIAWWWIRQDKARQLVLAAIDRLPLRGSATRSKGEKKGRKGP